jgi:hypothetical protein
MNVNKFKFPKLLKFSCLTKGEQKFRYKSFPHDEAKKNDKILIKFPFYLHGENIFATPLRVTNNSTAKNK